MRNPDEGRAGRLQFREPLDARKTVDRPTRQNVGEFGNVALVVSAIDAERVKFEDFAREVLVDAARQSDGITAPAAALLNYRIGSNRLHLVEIEQHGRMQHRRLEQIGKLAQHIRPNGAEFVIANLVLRTGLARRDAEMVRPEVHQPLYERCVALNRDIHARADIAAQDLVAIHVGAPDFRRQSRERVARLGHRLGARHRGCAFGHRHAPLAPELAQHLHDLARLVRGILAFRDQWRGGLEAVELSPQIPHRIAGRGLAMVQAIAEAGKRDVGCAHLSDPFRDAPRSCGQAPILSRLGTSHFVAAFRKVTERPAKPFARSLRSMRSAGR